MWHIVFRCWPFFLVTSRLLQLRVPHCGNYRSFPRFPIAEGFWQNGRNSFFNYSIVHLTAASQRRYVNILRPWPKYVAELTIDKVRNVFRFDTWIMGRLKFRFATVISGDGTNFFSLASVLGTFRRFFTTPTYQFQNWYSRHNVNYNRPMRVGAYLLL